MAQLIREVACRINGLSGHRVTRPYWAAKSFSALTWREMDPQPFHVGDEVVGRVSREVDGGIIGERPAPPAHPLIEQHDPVAGGVEGSPGAWAAAGAGTPVHHQGRLSGRVAACLPVDKVAVADIEHARLLRLNRRIPHVHADNGIGKPSAPSGSWAETSSVTSSGAAAGWVSSHAAQAPMMTARASSSSR